MTGVAPRGTPPAKWDENTHIRWKIPIRGLSHASPIVWGDRVFITTAIALGDPLAAPDEHDSGAHDNMPASYQQEFRVMAVRKSDGTTLWQRTLAMEQPHEGTHYTGSWASNSSATDGRRVYAYLGSRGLHCLDLDGNALWNVDLGDMKTRHGHGEGSSPALHGNTLVINWDHQDQSFVVAFDTRTGSEKWRQPRDEMTSWSSPLIVEHDGRFQVVIAATGKVRGYDLNTGTVIWECAGLSRNVVATPVASQGIVVVANSYDWQAMMAIRYGAARGQITDTPAVLWKVDRHTSYVPSPLLYDDHLYYIKHLQGLVSCAHLKTGKSFFGPQRLRNIDQVFASPVGAAGRVYVTARNGTTAVFKHGPRFEHIATNALEDSFSASPAIVGDAMFMRGEGSLYCIGTPTAARPRRDACERRAVVTLTAEAVVAIGQLLNGHPGAGLAQVRVSAEVLDGALHYGVEFTDTADPVDDLCADQDGVRMLVDRRCAAHLQGVRIGFGQTADGVGFSFETEAATGAVE
jgi:outer membrane protein assembly factor BamB/Fe-S cluster assembly iron-binding protein IscA